MDETFKVFHRVLSIAGISIYAKRNWDSKGWLLLQIFNFILGFLTFLFTSGFVASNVSNLLLFIQGACIWTTGVIMFITLGVCLYFKRDFRAFLEEIAFSDLILEMPLIEHVVSLSLAKGKVGELKTMVLDSQKKLLKYTRILFISYVASVWLCASLYLCTPIYLMCVTGDENLRLLAFDMWFPWGLENFAVFVASFIFHAYAGYLCCIAYPGLQSTIFFMVGQIVRQLRIMCFIMLNLDDLAGEIVDGNLELRQTVCTQILSQCVAHYVKIKRFANRLNVICQPFYLALVLVAVMLVCMCSVKIAISDKLSMDTAKYYVHEFCFILVVLLFCSLGQQVQNECEKLEVAVLEKWYIFNAKHKNSVRIFHMALGQRMPIYIFGSVTLSLPTFTWFIKTGMSFFTLVMSFLEEQ
ncbi:uncharacterized protein LOC121727783 [Aricia agestis]|uniref:uncharacterized protein LOC121727783 n=1 Tax=Aricia agestis TaxID=91739 RepID=UPI001C2015E5|nr:uncharacterized protein LOC121727783 [Aricia agestis]